MTMAIQSWQKMTSAITREKCFFFLYAIYEITYLIFGASLINTFFNTSLLTMSLNLIVIIGLSILIITDHFTFNQILLVSLALIFGLYSYFVVHTNVVFIGLLFMAAAKNISLNKFIKKDFTIRVSLVSSIIIMNRFGLIPSVTGMRDGTFSFMRDSLGFVQFNVTGALIMICILEYVYLNFGKLSSAAYQFITLVIVLNLMTTNSRGSMIASIIYLACSLAAQFQFEGFKLYVDKYKNASKYLFVVFSIISIIVVALFVYKSAFWSFINRLSSDRVNILNYYFEHYGIGLLPQYVGHYRSAGIVIMDNVFVTMAIEYGIIIWGLFMMMYYTVCRRAIKANNMAFMLLVVSLMIFGIIESSFYVLGINFTMMMVYADLSPLKRSESQLGSEKE